MTTPTAAPRLAVYPHREVTASSRPHAEIATVGLSLPHYAAVFAQLAPVAQYPALLLARADFARYATVHTPAYLAALQALAAGHTPDWQPLLGGECSGLEHCLPGYTFALGGMCAAIDAMRAGQIGRAYCLSLGGHHAGPDWGHGYCLLNPLAAATRYAQQIGFARVLLIDWDHHHGDGTQAIFAHDPSVYCISIHSAFDLYMAKMRHLPDGTTTAARALGHCNIPLRDQRFPCDIATEIGLDGEFYDGSVSIDVFATALAQLPWIPDLIGIFSGYDAHHDDCGARVSDWTTDDFARLTQLVLAVAQHAGCPVLSVHGGGYKLPSTIAAATRHLAVLAGEL